VGELVQFVRLDYLIPVAAAVAIALLFPVTGNLRDPESKRSYYRLQAITLVGAVLGAKLSVWFGDYGWPFREVPDWHVALLSGRSLTGGLIGGFLAAEVAKPVVRYRLAPNDRFATLLPFTLALGRVGCTRAGCCRGIPWDGPWAIRYSDGIARHPAQIYELLFQLAIGGLFVLLMRRGKLHGRLFALYLVVYGVFRFGIEYLRETPKWIGVLSGYQVLSLAMILLGAAFLLARTVRTPEWSDSIGGPLARKEAPSHG
jgi:phosphatidylglycerol---prolipoprotein diacylglyceryl transferase